MDSAINDLTKKAQKLKINEGKEKNWNNLPADLKMECIDRMKFKTRLSLRLTARNERKLVDSRKVHFSKVCFAYDTLPQSIYAYAFTACKFGQQFQRIPFTGEQVTRCARLDQVKINKVVLPFMAYVLKVGIFDKLAILTFGPSFLTDAVRKYSKDFESEKNTFRIKYFVAGTLNRKDAFFILKRMDKNFRPDKIRIDASALRKDPYVPFSSDNDFPTEEFINIPVVTNVSVLQIKNLPRMDVVWTLIEKWIEKDVELGRTLQFSTPRVGVPRLFAAKFKDRTVTKCNCNVVRISMNNKEKQVLLQLFERSNGLEFIQCSVIRTAASSPDCEEDTEWVHKLLPVVLSCDDGDSE